MVTATGGTQSFHSYGRVGSTQFDYKRVGEHLSATQQKFASGSVEYNEIGKLIAQNQECLQKMEEFVDKTHVLTQINDDICLIINSLGQVSKMNSVEQNIEILTSCKARLNHSGMTLTSNKVNLLAQGKVKNVWVMGNKAQATHVYYTVRGKNLMSHFRAASRLAELKKEVQTAKTISENLKKSGINASRNLAVDLTEVTSPEERIRGEYTVKSSKATRSLEGLLNEGSLSMDDALKYSADVLQGMSDLQEAGFANGDVKAENALVYPGDPPTVKISDFGKARQIKEGQRQRYFGNPRYAPPENTLSQKGEVYSTGLLLIRILEQPYLADCPNNMLKMPEKRKLIAADKRRSGVERFVTESAMCSQTENAKLQGNISVLFGRVASFVAPSERGTPQAEKEIQDYINELTSRMELRGVSKTKAKAIQGLLIRMTLSDPQKRISMKAAQEQFQALMKLT